jgi:hypothetical protein
MGRGLREDMSSSDAASGLAAGAGVAAGAGMLIIAGAGVLVVAGIGRATSGIAGGATEAGSGGGRLLALGASVGRGGAGRGARNSRTSLRAALRTSGGVAATAVTSSR